MPSASSGASVRWGCWFVDGGSDEIDQWRPSSCPHAGACFKARRPPGARGLLRSGATRIRLGFGQRLRLRFIQICARHRPARRFDRSIDRSGARAGKGHVVVSLKKPHAICLCLVSCQLIRPSRRIWGGASIDRSMPHPHKDANEPSTPDPDHHKAASHPTSLIQHALGARWCSFTDEISTRRRRGRARHHGPRSKARSPIEKSKLDPIA